MTLTAREFVEGYRFETIVEQLLEAPVHKLRAIVVETNQFCYEAARRLHVMLEQLRHEDWINTLQDIGLTRTDRPDYLNVVKTEPMICQQELLRRLLALDRNTAVLYVAVLAEFRDPMSIEQLRLILDGKRPLQLGLDIVHSQPFADEEDHTFENPSLKALSIAGNPQTALYTIYHLKETAREGWKNWLRRLGF